MTSFSEIKRQTVRHDRKVTIAGHNGPTSCARVVRCKIMKMGFAEGDGPLPHPNHSGAPAGVLAEALSRGAITYLARVPRQASCLLSRSRCDARVGMGASALDRQHQQPHPKPFLNVATSQQNVLGPGVGRGRAVGGDCAGVPGTERLAGHPCRPGSRATAGTADDFQSFGDCQRLSHHASGEEE